MPNGAAMSRMSLPKTVFEILRETTIPHLREGLMTTASRTCEIVLSAAHVEKPDGSIGIITTSEAMMTLRVIAPSWGGASITV